MKKVFSITFLLATMFVANAQSTDNLKVVDSSTTFKGLTQPIERGTLIKTANFHYYEINDKVVQKAGYSAMPKITVYQDGKKYKMKIEGMEKILTVNKLQEVFETRIEGYMDNKDLRDFKGYDGTTTFRLLNGQDWKQDEMTSNVFSNLFKPAVTVFLTPEGYKMKIEGVNESPILVKKIK